MSNDELIHRAELVAGDLLVLTVASCTCQTKTNIHSYHKEDCRYRILIEAVTVISDLLRIVRPQ
jgi:hypothetical protein